MSAQLLGINVKIGMRVVFNPLQRLRAFSSSHTPSKYVKFVFVLLFTNQMLGNKQSNSLVDAESLNFDPTTIDAAHNASQDEDKVKLVETTLPTCIL